MISVLKNVYSDKLADIVNQYNSAYLNTVIIKPVDVDFSTNIVSDKENNEKDPKL